MNIDRSSTLRTLKHEFGHLVMAKCVGFKTGYVEISTFQAGAIVTLCPKLITMEDVKHFLLARALVLYAGVLGESLSFGQFDEESASLYLTTTAANDHAKIRELVRMLAGVGIASEDEDDFQIRVNEVDAFVQDKAAQFTLKNENVIDALALYFLEQQKGGSLEKGGRGEMRLSSEKIDRHLAISQIQHADIGEMLVDLLA